MTIKIFMLSILTGIISDIIYDIIIFALKHKNDRHGHDGHKRKE